MKELQFLEEQQVSPGLIREVEKFRETYEVPEDVKNRIARPPIPFYGKEILEMAIAALLQGENILLSGSKATGKNILAENLSWIFCKKTGLSMKPGLPLSMPGTSFASTAGA